eukprot:15436195-Alexandrium_andersonii.AAC.1
MDYCFLAKDASETSLTVLVLKDRDSRTILAHPVLRKGRLHEDTVGQAVSSIRRPGASPRGLAQDGQRAGLGGPPCWSGGEARTAGRDGGAPGARASVQRLGGER